MMELFTLEEINLICAFSTDSLEILIADLREAILSFDEPDLHYIARNALGKLEKMSEGDYEALEFYPEYGDYGEEV
jgi:hypothetical protein